MILLSASASIIFLCCFHHFMSLHIFLKKKIIKMHCAKYEFCRSTHIRNFDLDLDFFKSNQNCIRRRRILKNNAAYIGGIRDRRNSILWAYLAFDVKVKAKRRIRNPRLMLSQFAIVSKALCWRELRLVRTYLSNLAWITNHGQHVIFSLNPDSCPYGL